ncbi:response regulator transcription factor [Alkaliphilus transvaalensis]|uniref:response regulator transcription factor n=1 Tax=Alkaliphilus transvaalensis TaxID=114628 RepID=UPI00047D3C0A|nr:response regulator transcription factor [Alkaliphilus transvaalensis]
MIKVLIVDDDQIIRESMKIILSMEKDIKVVGTCCHGDEAYTFCREYPVDVILMDIRMPICDGVLGTKKILESFKHIKIIILTTFDDDRYIVDALKNGASGYLLKNISPDKVIEAIKVVEKGNMLIHPEIAPKVTGLLIKQPEVDYLRYQINEGEMQIIKHIADGYSNRDIAEKVFLSEGTVKNKITDILAKLNLRDRTQIAIFHLKGGKVE